MASQKSERTAAELSRCRPPKLQIMLVAGPRNQHYLHEVVIAWRPLISPTAKRRQRRTRALRPRRPEHCRQVALQLDL
jgi:hypothetical protein